jgi:23S rRNA maturation mini-RNase III
MKMMSKMAMMFTGTGILGYMYLKKHPEKIQMLKDTVKDASKNLYNKLDSE